MSNKCKYCFDIKSLGYFDIETLDGISRIFMDINGQAIRVFDDNYPGFTEHIPIKYCPMCGRKFDFQNESGISGVKRSE